MRFDCLPWREPQIPINLSQGRIGALLPRGGLMVLFNPQFVGAVMRMEVMLILGAVVTVPIVLAR